MKVALVPPPPPTTPAVQITMTLEEARLLKWMMGLNHTIPLKMAECTPYGAHETSLLMTQLCGLLYPLTGI